MIKNASNGRVRKLSSYSWVKIFKEAIRAKRAINMIWDQSIKSMPTMVKNRILKRLVKGRIKGVKSCV